MPWIIFLQAAATQQTAAPAIDDKIIAGLIGLGSAFLVQYVSRGWSRDTREMDQIREKDHEQDQALLRIELDMREVKAFLEPFKESIRLSIAPYVPRDNPLSPQANRTIAAWHAGIDVPYDLLIEAAEEVHAEGQHDPKLTEPERMMFSATAASMSYDAEQKRTAIIRAERGIA